MNRLLGNNLIGLVLREGLGKAAGNQIRKLVKNFVSLIVYYAIVAVFALAGLAFLYVLFYEWLAQSIDPISAAAILCGGNFVLAALMLAIRRMTRRRARPLLLPASVGMASPAVATGVAIGRNLRSRLRQTTPQLVLAAAVIGLVIGIRPQILGALRRRPKGQTPAEKNERRR